MNVFISWSGSASQRLATEMHLFLPKIVPGVIPFISTEDIRKGNEWFKALSSQLSSARVCVVLLNSENLNSPWLYFEAGIVYANYSDSIMPLWCDIAAVTIDTPFGHFQVTTLCKEEWRKLIRALNSMLPVPHSSELLDLAVDKYWSCIGVTTPVSIEVSKSSLEVSEIADKMLAILQQSKSRQLLAYAASAGFVVSIDDLDYSDIGAPQRCLELAISELESRKLICSYKGRRDLFDLL